MLLWCIGDMSRVFHALIARYLLYRSCSFNALEMCHGCVMLVSWSSLYWVAMFKVIIATLQMISLHTCSGRTRVISYLR